MKNLLIFLALSTPAMADSPSIEEQMHANCIQYANQDNCDDCSPSLCHVPPAILENFKRICRIKDCIVEATPTPTPTPEDTPTPIPPVIMTPTPLPTAAPAPTLRPIRKRING